MRNIPNFVSCISFDSYIKPQLASIGAELEIVVYLLIPTSNHNEARLCTCRRVLYIFCFLHQTTTIVSYYIYFICCISFDSYIKPQLIFNIFMYSFVVYLLIPTSNHNYLTARDSCGVVVYLLIPTSNHNVTFMCL